MATNHALALKARATILCEALGVPPPAPESMLGVDGVGAPARLEPDTPARRASTASSWRTGCASRGVEAWFYWWPPSGGGKLVRVSAQLYNSEEQYVRLAGLLAEALRVKAGRAAGRSTARLGTFDTAMVVVSLVVGIGIFRTPAIVAKAAGNRRAASSSRGRSRAS